MDRKFFLLATLVFCAMGGFLYWQLIFLPNQNEILKFHAETQRIKLLQAEILNLQAKHDDLSEFVEEIAEQRDFAQEYLPEEMNDEGFIAELYGLAESERIAIYSVKTGEISSGEVQRQSIRIRLEADYISLLNFIRAVLDGSRLVSLESFSIISNETNILDCELEFLIYAAAVANLENM